MLSGPRGRCRLARQHRPDLALLDARVTVLDAHGALVAVDSLSASMIAGQIEASTRRFLADLIISDATLVASGRSYPEAAKHVLAIKGRQKSVTVHALHGAELISESEKEPEQA